MHLLPSKARALLPRRSRPPNIQHRQGITEKPQPQKKRTGLRNQVSMCTQSSTPADKSHAEYDYAVAIHLAKSDQCRLKYSDADFSFFGKARSKLHGCVLEAL